MLFSIASGMRAVKREGFPLKEDSWKICACFGDRELIFGVAPENIWKWGDDLQRHYVSGVCHNLVSSSLKACEQKVRGIRQTS